MVCLRCGTCCISHEVIIVDDPAKGIRKGNLIPKHTGDKCKHLVGVRPGEFSCGIHHYKWYKKTPCAHHGQIEAAPDRPCRLGAYVLSKMQASC
jgi:hypothetical protein